MRPSSGVLRADEYDALKRERISAWKGAVRGFWPEVEPHLDSFGSFQDLTLARYTHATLKVPAGEGIAFVGDSAHSTSPQLGQGTNMALLDARALSKALEQTSSVAEAMETYAKLRRWHVRLYQAMSLALTPLYQSDSRVLPVLRDFAVSQVGRLGPVQQLLAMMVAGTLLNPLRTLQLRPAPEIPPESSELVTAV